MKNQLTKGKTRRVMYIENKDGTIDDGAKRPADPLISYANQPGRFAPMGVKQYEKTKLD